MPRLFGRNFTRRQLLNRVGDISQLMYARRAERTLHRLTCPLKDPI